MLPEPLENNPQAIARRDAARGQLIPQIAGGKLIVRAAVGAFHRNACHGLIALERDLARHGNQVKGSGRCLCGGGDREAGNYSECKKTHVFTVHGLGRLKEECG